MITARKNLFHCSYGHLTAKLNLSSYIFFAAHLEERKAFALVEDEVLVDEGRLRGNAFITGARLVLQRVLNRTKRRNKVKMEQK